MSHSADGRVASATATGDAGYCAIRTLKTKTANFTKKKGYTGQSARNEKGT
jgi:hypothetical protein